MQTREPQGDETGDRIKEDLGKACEEDLRVWPLELGFLRKEEVVYWVILALTATSNLLVSPQAYRFSQLPEMVMGSPPPPVPPRTGPVAVASLRR